MIHGRTESLVQQVDVATRDGSYPVLVGRGLVSRLADLLADHAPASRVALISDDRVSALHGAAVAAVLRAEGVDVLNLTFPAGEASKTRKSWSILTDSMLDARLGRDCVVVAVGGGVTTDLAGFVAATYLRGVPVVHVPTSYLAMIDATVGGKTGVDVRAGKNLVGAFHSPSLVVADTDVLRTLPPVQRGQGLVEGFKHGAILDESHFTALASGFEALMRADPDEASARVADSVRIKAAVVAQDEFEGGYRQVLNFGHTVGHAIEAASGYSLGHGTAVALGMLAEAELGEAVGVTAPGTRTRLARTLSPILRDAPPFDDVSRVMGFLDSDKKTRAGRPHYVLLERIGVVAGGEGWTHTVPHELVETAVRHVLVQRVPGRDVILPLPEMP